MKQIHPRIIFPSVFKQTDKKIFGRIVKTVEEIEIEVPALSSSLSFPMVLPFWKKNG